MQKNDCAKQLIIRRNRFSTRETKTWNPKQLTSTEDEEPPKIRIRKEK